MSDTTFIFVPGAWHNPTCWLAVGSKLQTAGFNVMYVALPSVGPDPTLVPQDLSADVAKIKSAIEKAASAGQKVIVVAHSYGGIPASEAVHGLDMQTLQSRNGITSATTTQIGAVTRMIFVAAFMIMPGKSLQDTMGPAFPQEFISPDSSVIMHPAPALAFYNDLPEDLVDAAIASLKPHAAKTFTTPLKAAGWMDVPWTYVACANDKAIPFAIQKVMAVEAGMKSKGVKGQTMETTLDSGHSPFLSRAEELTQLIQTAARY